MTRAERLKLLTIWQAHFQRLELVYGDLCRLFGAQPESEIVTVLYELHHAYTTLMAEKVGDQDGWLDWYLWENDCGKKGLKAKAAHQKRPKRIRTLQDLATLIAET